MVNSPIFLIPLLFLVLGGCKPPGQSSVNSENSFSRISFEPFKYGHFTSPMGLLIYQDASRSFIQITADWDEKLGSVISYQLVEDKISDDWTYTQRLYKREVDPIIIADSLLNSGGLVLSSYEINKPSLFFGDSLPGFELKCSPIGGKWCSISKLTPKNGLSSYIGFSTSKNSCLYEHLQWIEISPESCDISEIPTTRYGSLEGWIRSFYSPERKEEIIFVCQAFPEKNGSVWVKVLRRQNI